jgi:hypothetical protein
MAVSLFPSPVDATCNAYSNSSVQWDPYYGNYCGATGGGCTECVDGEYSSCVTNGSSCTPKIRHQDF